MSLTLPAHVPTTTLRVCDVDDLPAGLGRTFDVAGLRIALFRTRQGMIVATDAACPHAGAPLADGMVVDQCVVCPYHARRFDLTSGQCDGGHADAIRTFPAIVRDAWVFVDIPVRSDVA